MFTTEHYVEIAKVINNNMSAVANGNESPEVFAMVQTIGCELADMFQHDNKLFDRNLFLKACGIE